jgi:hypothetical protein
MTMTDYEMFSVFSEITTTLNTILMDYVAVVFAFLIAAFFAASKLKQSMILVVTSLFTVFAMYKLYEAVFWSLDLNRLQGVMGAAVVQSGSSLTWLGFATFGSGATMATFLAPLIIVFGFVASLIFFFHQRYQGQRTS